MEKPRPLIEHQHGRPQGWETADTEVRDFINATAEAVRDHLQPYGFVGAYLHGSLAMGSYYFPKSDLDVLFVVEQPLDANHRRSTAELLRRLSLESPGVGGLETSVVLKRHTTDFRHPLPYETHYSDGWYEKGKLEETDWSQDSTDIDLTAYCKAIRARGVCLVGEPIEEVFGPVSDEAHRLAIIDDFDWIISDENITTTPFYGILNCCRVMVLQEHGWDTVITKEEGGKWALEHIPEEHRPVVAQALECYRSSEPVPPELRRTDGHGWDTDALLRFRNFVRQRVDHRD